MVTICSKQILSVSTREQNERKFPNWDSRCWILAHVRGRQLESSLVKEVDADEVTVRFYPGQIYSETGTLVEIHYKYPIDAYAIERSKNEGRDYSPNSRR